MKGAWEGVPTSCAPIPVGTEETQAFLDIRLPLGRNRLAVVLDGRVRIPARFNPGSVAVPHHDEPLTQPLSLQPTQRMRSSAALSKNRFGHSGRRQVSLLRWQKSATDHPCPGRLEGKSGTFPTRRMYTRASVRRGRSWGHAQWPLSVKTALDYQLSNRLHRADRYGPNVRR